MPRSLLVLSDWIMPAEALAPLSRFLARGYDDVRVLDWLDCTDADDIKSRAGAALAALNGPVDLLGWSLGALVSLELCLYSPDKISRSVLLSPSACFLSGAGYPYGWTGAKFKTYRAMAARAPRELTAAYLQLCSEPGALDTESDPWYNHPLVNAVKPETLLCGLDYLENTDLRPGLSLLKTSVLCIAGSRDAAVPLEAADWFVRNSGERSMLIRLEGAGHFFPIVSPAAVNALAWSFFTEESV